MKDFSHGGDVYSAAEKQGVELGEIIDLSSNVNPVISKEVAEYVQNNVGILNRLPEPFSRGLIQKCADVFDLGADELVAGNGTSELIDIFCRINKGKRALILQPTYVEYEKYCDMYEIDVSYEFLQEDKNFKYTDSDFLYKLESMDIMFICNPNNPTGSLISKDEIRFLAEIYKNVTFVIDESYIAFTGDCGKTMLGVSQKNVFVLKSFSKKYGVPGLRSGIAYSKNRALIEEIENYLSPWSVNVMAQEVSKLLLDIDASNIVEENLRVKSKTVQSLMRIKGVKPFIGSANFILIKLEDKTSEEACDYFLENNLLVRDCSNFVGLDKNFIRVSVRKEKEMEFFTFLLKEFMEK